MELRTIIGVALLGSMLSACSLLTPLPDRTRIEQRLTAFPQGPFPLERPVVIHWDAHQIPFIEAETDTDLAFALGLVHAHLRWAQIELLRHVAHGRLSEMVGPIATDIDHSLRILDLGRSAPASLDLMPADSRRWLDSFVAGLNHYIAHAEELPHEFKVLGLKREPWSPADVLTIGRLASVDVNWLVWFEVLKLRDRTDWPEIWDQLVRLGSDSVTSFMAGAEPERAALGEILAGMNRSGSNAVAVSAARSESGGALIASDPHLGIFLPNLWLLAGYKSPSYHAVGMMIPGIPFLALGRNPWIAWGGTNMRSASSDLYDVSELPAGDITTTESTIATRWWFDETVTLRNTPLGPVVTDAPVLDTGSGGPLALRWMGHLPSDEISAMLAANRARDWNSFREALDEFHVPGQNMIYADAEGHIGQVMAVRLPRRPETAMDTLVHGASAVDWWDSFATLQELPSAFDPPSGFLASANNKPVDAEVPVGFFFSPDDRIIRIRALLGGEKKISVAMLEELQQDVFQSSSVDIRKALVKRLETVAPAPALSGEARRVLDAIAGWDGHYTIDSTAAPAFELFLYHFNKAFYDERQLTVFSATAQKFAKLEQDILAAPDDRLAAAVSNAATAAAAQLDSFPDWGSMHRLNLGHVLSRAPVIGGRYEFADDPVAGSTATLMKTAHGLTNERHATRYGSQARHISDMSDLDANYFVLLGGEDGWINSANFIDQYNLWKQGAYVRLPLRPETVRATFPHHMTLSPRDSG